MRILYIARHGQNNADDEGAIAHALRELGCEVVCEQEYAGVKAGTGIYCDLLLFHHWSNFDAIQGYRCKKAFWYFDLVDWSRDPTLTQRSARRHVWASWACANTDFGFMTDGDFVDKWKGESLAKLYWLPQGADGRIVGAANLRKRYDILLTGIARGGGKDREEFVHDLKARHGSVYHAEKGIYREHLRGITGASRIVVCPDSPVTDRYWSNRVYNACGFGALVLHPRCYGLTEQYEDGKEIVYYDNREHMHKLIRWWLEDDTARRNIADAALERTKLHHTYLRRCEVLLATVRKS